jgi:hypothetical protein
MQMVLQKRIERKTASLLLYALQIASSNLKRMELEKPQPEQVVIDVVTPLKYEPPIAPPELTEKEEVRETAEEASAHAQLDVQTDNAQPIKPEPIMDRSREQEELPPGTIQACHRPLKRELRNSETGGTFPATSLNRTSGPPFPEGPLPQSLNGRFAHD